MFALFDPFGGKQIDELGISDLLSLLDNGVCEGQFVEYKSALPNARKLAKSVAAFANSHGGWLFLGIDADHDTNAATRLTGIDTAQNRNLADTVRNAVVGNVDPHPTYYPSIIPLCDGRAVAVVQVLEGHTPPYIHSDGRVYRRQGAGSDPVVENERHVIDQLYAKSERFHDTFRRFATSNWRVGKGQASYTPGWAEVYIMPEDLTATTTEKVLRIAQEPPDDVRRWWSGPQEWHCGHNDPSEWSGSVATPFDQCYATPEGHSVCQTTTRTGTVHLPLTVEAMYWGATRAFIPLERLPEEVLRNVRPVLARTWGADMGYLSVFDGDRFCRALFGTLLKCASHAERCGRPGRLRTKVRLANVWRATPHFGGQLFTKVTSNADWPASLRSDFEMPSELSGIPYETREVDSPGDFAALLSIGVLRAFGIPAGHVAGLLFESLRLSPE